MSHDPDSRHVRGDGGDPRDSRRVVAYDDLDGRPRQNYDRDERYHEPTYSRRHRDAREWDHGRGHGRDEYEGWRNHWREDWDERERRQGYSERGHDERSGYSDEWHGRRGDRRPYDEDGGWDRRRNDWRGERDAQEDERRYGSRDEWRERDRRDYGRDHRSWEDEGRYEVPSTSSRWAGRSYRAHDEDDRGGFDREREWGDSERPEMPPPATQLRLVKLSSDVIPETQHIAIIDARSDPVSIGRDRSFTARLRLPAMEISKHHANLFWMPSQDRSLGKFQITDTGSTHGTFLLAHAKVPNDLAGDGSAADEAAEQGLAALKTPLFQRLAEPKKASAPQDLGHGDLLRLGKTTMQVHLHPGGLACALCSVGGDLGRNEIPLLPNQQGGQKPGAAKEASAAGAPQDGAGNTAASYEATVVSAPLPYGGDRKVESEMVRRNRMKELRATYLGADEAEENEKRERARDNWRKKKEKERAAKAGEGIKVLGAEETRSKTGGYIDRAAQRRALQGSLPPASSEAGQRARIVIPGPQAAPQPQTQSADNGSPRGDGDGQAGSGWKPAAALDGRNKGFQLYARMGVPSAGTSSTGEARSEDVAADASTLNQQAPIEARGVTGRAGLGAAKLLSVEELGRASGGAGLGPSPNGGHGKSRSNARDYVERGLESARRRLEREMGQEG